MGEQTYLKLLLKLNMADRRRGRLRRMSSKRVNRDRLKPLGVYTDDELFERYRFRHATIVILLDIIGSDLLDSSQKLL